MSFKTIFLNPAECSYLQSILQNTQLQKRGGILLCTCKINLFLQLKHSQSVMFICYSNLIYSKRKKESMKILPLLQSNSFLKGEKKKKNYGLSIWISHSCRAMSMKIYFTVTGHSLLSL